MCIPAAALGALSFAASAGSAVASYVGQQQEAKQNEENSIQSWKNQQTQITQREMQEQDALHQKQAQENIQEAQALADTEASAAASGVSGVSLDNLLNDVSRRAATNRQTMQDNTDMTFLQLQQQRKGINAEAQSRINSVSAPSPLSLIAGLGSSGVSGYDSYLAAKEKMK